ncbi:hypothetical protein BOTNAR_0090g00230 [Botryotinia narcissicola]|uniref:Uncharacterized protein n=1 Tax=Botryotinia narcissicola TaxID=278944 RepID=A0A4Z1J593_9HELO|nr:hypothetical protein BOTNAR_0090g00230 [Botryotinia narcissicola]
MSDSEELTEADDIDPSLIEDLNPDYHFPSRRHNFHWITVVYKYLQFASDTCANNQAKFVVKRAPVERRWLCANAVKQKCFGAKGQELLCVDAKMTLSRCIEDYGVTQDEFVTANGSTSAVV